jgi:hypothetical protein
MGVQLDLHVCERIGDRAAAGEALGSVRAACSVGWS